MAHIRRHRGKWQVMWRDPVGRQRAKVFDRKSDAKQWAVAVEADKVRGTYNDPRLGQIRFSDWAGECFDSRLNIRGATRARDESLLRNHVLPAFGDTPLGRVSRADVQGWVRDLSDRGVGDRKLAPRTVRECYRVLGGIMAAAVEQRLIAERPCRKVALPRVDRQERRFLSPDEVEQLIQAVPALHRALVYSAAYLGCRWEELAGLKRSRLDLLRKQVRIAASIERVAGTYRYVEETKSAAARRTLRLPDFLVEVLARHLETAPSAEWVFPARQGGHLRYDNFRVRVWDPAVDRAGLAPLTFHELRHTAAAVAINEGVDPLQLQRRLGHKDIATTLGVYGHLWPNREDELVEALDRVHREAKARVDVDQLLTSTVVKLPE